MTPPHPPAGSPPTRPSSRLGVSRQTLYAYVSRGRIGVTRRAGRSAAQPVRRGRCAPARRTQPQRTQPPRRRRLDDQAGASRSWPPRITRIEGGRLEYRGQDAIALSATATLEDSRRTALAGGRPAAASARARGLAAGARRCGRCRALHRRDGGTGDGRPLGRPGAQRAAGRRPHPRSHRLGGVRCTGPSVAGHRRCRCMSAWRPPGASGRRPPT